MVWRFLEKSTLFYLACYEAKNVSNTLNFVSYTCFVHILTVYRYASFETCTSYIVNPCGRVPRPIYISSRASDSQSSTINDMYMLLITLIAFQLHVVFNTPEKFWLISRLFDVVMAEVPPPVLSSTWRDLAFSPDAQSLLVPSFAFHSFPRHIEAWYAYN